MTIGDALGYYEVLEVHPEAGSETIKQQYHVLAKKWHPDRNTDEKAGEIFQKGKGETHETNRYTVQESKTITNNTHKS